MPLSRESPGCQSRTGSGSQGAEPRASVTDRQSRAPCPGQAAGVWASGREQVQGPGLPWGRAPGRAGASTLCAAVTRGIGFSFCCLDSCCRIVSPPLAGRTEKTTLRESAAGVCARGHGGRESPAAVAAVTLRAGLRAQAPGDGPPPGSQGAGGSPGAWTAPVNRTGAGWAGVGAGRTQPRGR